MRLGEKIRVLGSKAIRQLLLFIVLSFFSSNRAVAGAYHHSANGFTQADSNSYPEKTLIEQLNEAAADTAYDIADASDYDTTANILQTSYTILNDTSHLILNNAPDSAYEKIKKGIDYSAEKYAEPKPFSWPQLNVNEGIVKTVVITLIILVALFVIYGLFRNMGADKKIQKSVYMGTDMLDDASENLDKTDLEKLLDNALSQNDYKSAVRIYYLMVLKSMWQKKLLHWRKEKTNGDYLAELYGGSWFDNFRTSTLHFETTWYGNRDLRAPDFEKLQNSYVSVLNKLKEYSHEA